MKQVTRTADWIVEHFETYTRTIIHTPTELPTPITSNDHIFTDLNLKYLLFIEF